MLIPFEQLNIRPKAVLHLGAHDGEEADTYWAFGATKVIWVEALPDVHRKLLRRIRRYEGSIALCACLSDEDGKTVPFNIASNEQSSSMLPFGTHLKAHPNVKYVQQVNMRTERVDTLLARHGLSIEPDLLWFLNVDLQGAELMALRGMGDLLHRFQYAYVEVNEQELYKGCPHVKEIDGYLGEFGFEGVCTKMTKAGWGDKFYKRSPR